MPSRPSPSSSVQAARQALADRLREIREDAGLSATGLAAAAGWYGKARVSKIERGAQPATIDDIDAWCRACGVPDQIADLTAQLKAAEGAYVEWRRLQRGGLKRLQESYVPLYERTRRFQAYSSQVIPGLLQTAGYASAILEAFAAQTGAEPDFKAAAAVRVERQRVLRTDKTFAFVVEESTLRAGVADAAVMAGQLAHLAGVASGSMRSASLGVIPARSGRTVWPLEDFWIFDYAEVQVEALTARITVTAPGEIGSYVRAFEALAAMAVYGDAAARLIEAAADEPRE